MNAVFGTHTNPERASASQREDERLADLRSYGILDTPKERQFDGIVALARLLFDTPIAAITLVDSDRQWFKAQAGLAATQTSREVSFCSHAIEDDGVFVVPDASLDSRFAENPLVTGDPNIRFYAGAPLHSAAGHNLGAMCVISPTARLGFSAEDRKKLSILADIVSNEMELKKQAQGAHQMAHDKDFAVREAHYRIKNSLDYATLLAEVQSDEMSTEQLSTIAMAAWQQYSQAGGVLNSSVKSLRARMTAQEYKNLLDGMPGFLF